MEKTDPTMLGELGASIVDSGGALSLVIIVLGVGAILYRREILKMLTTPTVSDSATAILVAIQRTNDAQLKSNENAEKSAHQSAEAFGRNLVYFEKLLVLVTELRDQAKANNDVLRAIRDVEKERAEAERIDRSVAERLRNRGQ